jgi:hypothetical protein
LALPWSRVFFVAGHPSKTFFHLAANIFGAATEAIVSHEVILLRFALPTAAVGIGSTSGRPNAAEQAQVPNDVLSEPKLQK